MFWFDSVFYDLWRDSFPENLSNKVDFPCFFIRIVKIFFSEGGFKLDMCSWEHGAFSCKCLFNPWDAVGWGSAQINDGSAVILVTLQPPEHDHNLSYRFHTDVTTFLQIDASLKCRPTSHGRAALSELLCDGGRHFSGILTARWTFPASQARWDECAEHY